MNENCKKNLDSIVTIGILNCLKDNNLHEKDIDLNELSKKCPTAYNIMLDRRYFNNFYHAT